MKENGRPKVKRFTKLRKRLQRAVKPVEYHIEVPFEYFIYMESNKGNLPSAKCTCGKWEFGPANPASLGAEAKKHARENPGHILRPHP